MKDNEKNREHLLKDLAVLRRRVSELEDQRDLGLPDRDMAEDGERIFGLLFKESGEGILVADIEIGRAAGRERV